MYKIYNKGLIAVDAQQKFNEAWADTYKLKLAVIDHVKECAWLYDNKYKPKIDVEKNEYYKELADLLILLDTLRANRTDFEALIAIRFEKFKEKAVKERIDNV